MNTTYDRTVLLTKLSKLYVFGELGLDPKTFERTADNAWIGFADWLLRRHSPQRSLGMRRAEPSGRRPVSKK